MYRILFADDEPHIIDGLNLMIDWGEMGVEVIGFAEDGEDAFDMIKDTFPDVVIADISMPKLTGLELLEKCKAELADVPEIILLTGYGEMEYIKRAMKNGASGYMLKPLNAKEIVEHVELAIEKRVKKKEREAEFEEQVGYIAQELFSKIVYGEYDNNEIERMKFMLGMTDEEEYVSLIMISGKDSEMSAAVAEHIKGMKGVDKLSVFDIGFLYTGILTAYRTESELCGLAERIVAENEIEYVIILPPCKPERLANDVKTIIEARQHGYFTDKINNFYNGYNRFEENSENEYDVEKIKGLIHDGKISETIHIINAQFYALVNRGAGMRRMRGFASMILYELYKYIQRIGMDMSDDFNSFSYRLAMAKYSIEVRDICDELLEKIKISERTKETSSDYKTILDYIEKNYMNNITLSEIAKLIYVKPAAVSKMIKQATGMKFSDYINQLRMKEACRLIAKTDQTIAGIASDLGYGDYEYFANKFKKYAGCLPSQYRKRVQR